MQNTDAHMPDYYEPQQEKAALIFILYCNTATHLYFYFGLLLIHFTNDINVNRTGAT